VTLSDLENPDPQESDANCCNPNDGAAEEEKYKEYKQDIVDRKDFRGLHEDPVDGVEDVDIS
jgi:hypothetical protein